MPSKSGVALVVVLGFLSVLAVMAVAFAVAMRTERLASRAYVESMRAKFITEAAFARMMSDLDNALVAVGAYPRFSTVSGVPDVFHSKEPNGARSLDIFTLSGSFNTNLMRYSPRFLSSNERLIGWQLLTNSAALGTNIIGRYAYLVVDSSGLLDVNVAVGTNRLYGVSPAEIPLENRLFPEFESSTTNLPAARSNFWIRYESLPDFLALGRSNSRMPYNVLSSATRFTSNFTVFSYAPTGWFDTNTRTEREPVFIGGDEHQLTNNRSAIVEAFSLFTDASVAAQLADSLIDYVDRDFRPRQVDGICVEPTPLINEIVIEQRMENGTNNICRPRVELWFPFVGITNPYDYRVVLALEFSNAEPADYNPGPYARAVPVAGPWKHPRFVIVDFPPAIANSANPVDSFADFRARVVRAELREDSIPVDRVTNVFINLSFAQNDGITRTGGVAVVDPRLNHLADRWVPVGESSTGGTSVVTLGAFNTGVANPAAGDGLHATNIYIANRPLRNTGELGMLFKGDPWETISLLGSKSWGVLHVFTILSNRPIRGLININSQNTNVLAAAFLGAPVEMWPGHMAFANRLELTNAVKIAKDIADATFGNAVTNVGDIGIALGSDKFTGLNEWESESVLRNSGDLLTTRQNLFTAFLVGEALDQRGEPTARRGAVALIWRDPFPNRNRRHDWFVRYWQWIDLSE